MQKRRLVAVVDDDLSMLAGIENLLDAHGFSTMGFASAEAFLDFPWATTSIDCVLLDLHLGGMSGIELGRQLSSTLPIIFMTAFYDEAVRIQALQEGCVACLSKPFLSHLLIDAVEEAVASKRNVP
jgi:FixJ family two-component response regulator